jgi:hypothetical protein
MLSNSKESHHEDTAKRTASVVSRRACHQDVLLTRAGDRFFAVGAQCTHYHEGPIVLVSADEDPPVDRPNLSKDYLAGEAQDDRIPMWPSDAYAQRHIELWHEG